MKLDALLMLVFIVLSGINCSVDTVDKVSGMRGETFVYRINSENCTQCGKCVVPCPDKAIIEYQLDKTTWGYVIDPEKCTGCGICLDYCEDAAIELVPYVGK